MIDNRTPQPDSYMSELQQRIDRLEAELADARQTHQGLVNMVDRVGDTFVALDSHWHYRYINPQALTLVGMDAEQVLGKTIWDLFPQYVGTIYETYCRQAMETQAPVSFEAQGLLSDRWYETTVYPSGEGITIYSRDITLRKRAEEETRQTHEVLSTLLERVSDTFVALDHEWRFTYVNNRILEVLGMEREALIGRVYWDVFPDLVGTTMDDSYRRAMAEQIPLHVEFDGTDTSGGWYEINFYPSPDGISTFGRDITEEKRLQIQIENERAQAETERERLLVQLAKEQNRLRELTETLEKRVKTRTVQVQRLATSLLVAEHQERKRISQILHDHIQQMLYSVQWRMHMLEEDMETAGGSDVSVHLEEIKQIVAGAINATRTLTVELSPPVLETEGLAEALTWLADQMQELHSLQVSIVRKGDCGVQDKNLSRLIFQIVQELLFNVVKHAGVKEASVTLSCTDDQFQVMVNDQGCGFEVTPGSGRASNGTSFGLISIQERLDLFGGQIEITSTPGSGTTVRITAPLSA
jgi:two-component system, chemotaxis family, CheB/CheR fusion protein